MWLPFHRQPHFSVQKKRTPDENGSPFFMSKPNTRKIHRENVLFNGTIEAGHSSMQGYRVHMEDERIIDSMTELSDHILVAIMDGHAGTFSAHFTGKSLKSKIELTEAWQKYAALNPIERENSAELIGKAMAQAYLDLDDELRVFSDANLMDESGCTAVSAIVTPTHIVVASVGDSRSVLGSDSRVISFTEDHKPNLLEERRRIENAGGFVQFNRVNGELAMSRAIGDFRYKPSDKELAKHEFMVIAYPDIAIHRRTKDDRVMILACDGVFDVLSNDEAVSFVSSVLENQNDDFKTMLEMKGYSNKHSAVTALVAAEELIELALQEGSTDNISAIVVRFLKFSQ